MKLSKAILLGSTMVRPKAGGQFYFKTGQGCALGMAAFARGCTFQPITCTTERERRTFGVEKVWGEWVLGEVPRPCSCWRIWIPREMRIKDVIAHLFDHHVMRRRNWTLERLIAWVETVEPKEHSPLPAIPRASGWVPELPFLFHTGRVDEHWEARVKAFLDLAVDRSPGADRAATSLRLARYSSPNH